MLNAAEAMAVTTAQVSGQMAMRSRLPKWMGVGMVLDGMVWIPCLSECHVMSAPVKYVQRRPVHAAVANKINDYPRYVRC